MSKRKDGQPRGKYTLEFKWEAVRLVNGGQAALVTAKVLGIPKQPIDNWVRLKEKGQLKGAGDKPVSPEQMELALLRAGLARVKMESNILKKRWLTSPRKSCRRSATLARLTHPLGPFTLTCRFLDIRSSPKDKKICVTQSFFRPCFCSWLQI